MEGPVGPFRDGMPRPARARWAGYALLALLVSVCCGIPLYAAASLLARFGHGQEYMTGLRKASEHPIIHAAMLGNTGRIEELLAEGTAVDDRGEDGRTALHWAAFAGHDEVLALLLARGAAVGAVDRTGRTALHLAAEEGHPAAIVVLLQAGADAGARDRSGALAGDLAAARGHSATAAALREWAATGAVQPTEALRDEQE